MIDSVNRFVTRNPDVPVRLFLLLQRCDPQQARAVAETLPSFVSLHTIPHRVSSSAARNMMLGPDAAGGALRENDVLGFPDDDCWYPDGLLERIHGSFAADPQLDFWFCCYASKPAPPDSGVPVTPRLQNAVSRGACNTIFFRGLLARKIGYYDERLGVGAEIDGGEDTDFSIRAFYLARRSQFVNAPVIGHRDMQPEMRSRYFMGGFVVLAVHALKSPAGVLAWFRKLAVGLTLVGTGRMKLSFLLRGLWIVLTRNRPKFPVLTPGHLRS
ncbi:hypothetical protein [uncultured Methylobacterium sp.]|uniref:hypothetical protein n=1 Tax=uncultured Methylobacterium sp. TaxID=157278 RepID=UPI002629D9E7|nr:hypothetical protein [uncultured Methylobacterium sp.]